MIVIQRPERGAAPGADMLDLARYGDGPIAAVAHDPAGVSVTWADGRSGRFHALWLRDNCPCPACRHPQARERRFLFIDAPEDIPIAAAARTAEGDLAVTFAAVPGAEAHESRFGAGWLRHYCHADWARAGRHRAPSLWDARFEVPTFAYRDVMAGEEGLAAWLEALRRWSIARIAEAPAAPGVIRRIAERVGPVRPTNFGDVYDVVSLLAPNASAYTTMGLEPHTDLANWRWPPDYQLLFCIANEAEGGGSVLVDGFRVAAALREADPAAFHRLATTPIDFRFHDETCDIRHRAPTISLDPEGAVTAVRFNNWLRAALDVPEADVAPTYAALRAFWRLLRDPHFQLRLKLVPGDLIAFDNARVLHGRDPFDPNTGRRHLQGCYLDRDLVDSRLRLIARGASRG